MATNEEISRANTEYIKKERLENLFKPDIKRLFARMFRDFLASVTATGTIPNVAEYLSDWQSILKIQYDRVQRSFLGTVVDQQKYFITSWFLRKAFEKQVINEDEQLTASFATALVEWRNLQSKESARYITETNFKNMTESLNQSREILSENDESLDNRNVAITAAPILKRKFKGRVNSIAMTETQKAAESTKLFEAEVLTGNEPVVSGPVFFVTQSKKVWVDVGDKKVRKPHKAFNVAIVFINEPFIVGGQMLMYPGDSSMGASVSNTANCRCSSQYRIS